MGSDLDRAVERLREAGLPVDAAVQEALEALRAHAPASLPMVLGAPELLIEALRRDPRAPHDPERVAARWRRIAEQGDVGSAPAALRRERNVAWLRLALREAWEEGDVRERAAEWSDVASGCVDAALRIARGEEEARGGPIVSASGEPVGLVALGMGKLAGRELNLGSDVDLCFFYETDEVAAEAAPPFERFTRVVRRAVRLLGEVTAEGACFRVDLRLRPEGRGGPLVNSIASAERYYESWGRPWERAVLLRARPVGGELQVGERLLEALRPFVFPKRVDPSIVETLAEMLLRARREWNAGPEDVKLGPGGIREAEFFVQGLQLVWGGRHPEVRHPGTLEGLRRLRDASFVSEREAERLQAAWLLLRRVEHRIHLRHAHPTHRLPGDPEGLEALARSLGMGSAAALREALAAARRDVVELFGSLRPSAPAHARAAPAPWERLAARLAEGETPTPELLRAAFGEDGGEPEELLAHLRRLGRRADAPLGPVTLARFPRWPGLLLREVAESADPRQALAGLADFFGRCGPPELYVRLLAERPRLLRRLVSLLGASRALGESLVAHPEALDELLSRPVVPTPEAIAAAHRERLPPPPPAGDLEAFLSALRALRREVTLQVALAYAAGELDAYGVERPLSALADAQVHAALRAAASERRLLDERGETAGLLAIGLGKLGAGEMGFGSDLDLFFVHDEAVDPTHCIRAAQRAIRLLSQPDRAGRGYEVDTRLRPSGSHGLLVVSLSAFDRYHAGRAAPWERQALVRARPVAGDPALAEAMAHRLARLPYEAGAPPGEEVARLRRRIQLELAGERADRYHAKLGYGALLDVEFLLQVLQMRHGAEHSAVRRRASREALGALASEGLLGPEEAARLAEAHRFFRSVEQAIRFHDPGAEPVLRPGGPGAERLARRLGMRSGSRLSAGQRLAGRWRELAAWVRGRFEAHVAPVGAPAPWATRGERP